MYAIFEDGGKQYKVSQGDALLIETRELPENTKELSFDRVLMLGSGDGAKIGAPYVGGAKVTAVIAEVMKAPRVTGIKFSRRKGYRKKWGHRQPLLKVTITGIQG